MKTNRNKKILRPALAGAALACLLPMASWSLAAPKAGSGGSASADSSDALPGLDALVKDNEARVLDELSNDGLDTLLKREFDLDDTPQKQRDAIEAIGAVRLLNDPNAHVTDRQKLTLVEHVAEGLETAKATLPKDAARLEKYAQVLYTGGGKYFESTLEYWGESSLTQSQLKPIADAVCDLYKMASDAAEEECGKAATENDLVKARNLDQESQLDTYFATLFQYDRALATDTSTPQGKALRKQICNDAVGNLQQYDTADSTVQAVVELNMAKDLALEGKTADADKLFDNIIAGKTSPPAAPDQLNDAYY
ncbi:MAG TPA: hypothetical protein VHY37_02405, partial [Tepidisphaeraceae bacterium]|nr:hypothetical protein [Tepidisphaeraceae bacterium]